MQSKNSMSLCWQHIYRHCCNRSSVTMDIEIALAFTFTLLGTFNSIHSVFIFIIKNYSINNYEWIIFILWNILGSAMSSSPRIEPIGEERIVDKFTIFSLMCVAERPIEWKLPSFLQVQSITSNRNQYNNASIKYNFNLNYSKQNV